jgi:hypothetical protein
VRPRPFANKSPRYTDHAYIVLTLQKLVHTHPNDEDSDSESDDPDTTEGSSKPKRGRISKAVRKLFSRSKPKYDGRQRRVSTVSGTHDPSNGFVVGHTDGVPNADLQKLRTLQRYHGGPNQERMTFMECHSPLTKKELAVSAEQVSLFLTSGKL